MKETNKKKASRGRPFVPEPMVMYTMRIPAAQADWLRSDKANLAELRAWLESRTAPLVNSHAPAAGAADNF